MGVRKPMKGKPYRRTKGGVRSFDYKLREIKTTNIDGEDVEFVYLTRIESESQLSTKGPRTIKVLLSNFHRDYSPA